MKDNEVKEYVESHEELLLDIVAEIEELKNRLLKESSRRINIENILDTHRVEIKALSGVLKSMLKQVAQVESDITTGEATP